jgi:hypothetical protein
MEQHDIDRLLREHFPDYKIIHSYASSIGHFVFTCSIRTLLEDKLNIENWDYNRPPDPVRCKEIARNLHISNKEIESMFYICYDNTVKKFKIMDGIHRYTALQIVKRENSKSMDLLTPNEYGSNGDSTIYNKTILINIRMYSTIGEQIDVFQTLNKSNPVPELYIRDTSKERREIVQEVVDFWQKKYKSHFSPTPKPNVPNINRDKFIDILDKLCDKYKIRQENIQNLYDMLDEKNDELRNNIPKGLKEKTLEKCAKSGCYLFLFKPDVLECIL